MQHPFALPISPRAALVYRQFADLDQASACDVAAQAQQIGGVHLVGVAEAIGSAQ